MGDTSFVLVLTGLMAMIGIQIYAGVRTLQRRRWLWFFLGLFSGTIFWFYGAFAPTPYQRDSKRREKQRLAALAGGQPGVMVQAGIRADGRCPSCGKKGPHDGPRCAVCGHFFGR